MANKNSITKEDGRKRIKGFGVIFLIVIFIYLIFQIFFNEHVNILYALNQKL